MDSESSLTSFPSFCTQPSEVAALFNSNLSRLPFLGQVINSVLLLCRVCTGFDLEHVFLFLCHIFTQRPKNDRKVERSDVCCLGQQQLLTNSIEISFHMKKKSDLSLPEIYKALKPCWLLNWVSIARVEACFPQVCCSCCVLARPTDSYCPTHASLASRRAAPRDWPLILHSEPSITFWNSLQRYC